MTGETDSNNAPPSGDFAGAAGPGESAGPLALFQDWMRAAQAQELNDPDAMALATADSQGLPNVRMMLLKEASEAGFVFFTNLDSVKGAELAAQPKAALCFHWKSLRRQVRARGPVEAVSSREADLYFASRPLGSRIGAWASQQSRPLESRLALEQAVADYEAKFGRGEVPRPPYWSGFRLVPIEIEFWRGRIHRLHDRLLFRRAARGEPWTKTRLYP